MIRKPIAIVLSTLPGLCFFEPSRSLLPTKKAEKAPEKPKVERPVEPPVKSVTKHKIRVGGADLSYTATAET